MKKYILCLFVLLVFACQKEAPIFDKLGFYGEGSATLNGTAWKGKTGVFKSRSYCAPDTCISIFILHYNEANELRGKVLVDQVPLKKGKFQLNPIEPSFLDTLYRFTYSEFAYDGDVVTGRYKLAYPDSSYYINIQELNKQTGDISGKFRAKVVRDTSFIGSVPDTIDIENGSFYGKINWK